jgi:hypothetical protein
MDALQKNSSSARATFKSLVILGLAYLTSFMMTISSFLLISIEFRRRALRVFRENGWCRLPVCKIY